VCGQTLAGATLHWVYNTVFRDHHKEALKGTSVPPTHMHIHAIADTRTHKCMHTYTHGHTCVHVLQVRNTNEVALQRELLEARDAARRAEERASRALKAKVGVLQARGE